MPGRVWFALAGLIGLLLIAVLGLDRWQTGQGQPSLWSLLSLELRRDAPARRPEATSAPAPPAGRATPVHGRIAVIVDGLGSRRDVFDSLREIGAPISVAVLPGLPLSSVIAREARNAGVEVLLDLPLEPYRYPEIDPGPSPLLMSMAPARLGERVAEHLDVVPGVTGVVTHMGSRMTEDRARMRAVLAPVAARGLAFVDARTSSHSVAYDEAARLGIRAARRQVLIDPTSGAAAARVQCEAAARLAARETVVVLAHAHPLTVALLREYVPRWESAGLRLVPISRMIEERLASR